MLNDSKTISANLPIFKTDRSIFFALKTAIENAKIFYSKTKNPEEYNNLNNISIQLNALNSIVATDSDLTNLFTNKSVNDEVISLKNAIKTKFEADKFLDQNKDTLANWDADNIIPEVKKNILNAKQTSIVQTKTSQDCIANLVKTIQNLIKEKAQNEAKNEINKTKTNIKRQLQSFLITKHVELQAIKAESQAIKDAPLSLMNCKIEVKSIKEVILESVEVMSAEDEEKIKFFEGNIKKLTAEIDGFTKKMNEVLPMLDKANLADVKLNTPPAVLLNTLHAKLCPVVRKNEALLSFDNISVANIPNLIPSQNSPAVPPKPNDKNKIPVSLQK
jgi:hypothetical protein